MILKKLFGFDPSVMKVKTEIMAGVTTFLTMSYILAVNPDILSVASMDRGAVCHARISSAVTSRPRGVAVQWITKYWQ